MAKIVTLGEIMLRLSTPGFSRFTQTDTFHATYGGGEANVAVSLAILGHQTYFVSKVPNNDIGQSAINHLRRYGVNTEYMIRGGNRLGIYFLETGASMRPSNVIYDRAESAIAQSNFNEYDFDSIFNGAEWFHFTGITPALSDTAVELITHALKAARDKGATISVDLNFRSKLWSQNKARQVMKSLMQYVDVCIGNEEDAFNCLGYETEHTQVEQGSLNIEGYKSVMEEMQRDFGFKAIAFSLRYSHSASRNGWQGLLLNKDGYFMSNKYELEIIDRVGGGDSFAAGLIHAMVSSVDGQYIIDYAVAASALKHTIQGDLNLVNSIEIERLLAGDGSGRVQR